MRLSVDTRSVTLGSANSSRGDVERRVAGWWIQRIGRSVVVDCRVGAFARPECSPRSEQPPQTPPHVAVAPRDLACRCLLHTSAPSCAAINKGTHREKA